MANENKYKNFYTQVAESELKSDKGSKTVRYVL